MSRSAVRLRRNGPIRTVLAAACLAATTTGVGSGVALSEGIADRAQAAPAAPEVVLTPLARPSMPAVATTPPPSGMARRTKAPATRPLSTEPSSPRTAATPTARRQPWTDT